jgi:hypothetical protein
VSTHANLVLRADSQYYTDKWEWGTVVTCLLGGTGYAMLSFFNLKSSRPLVLPDKDPITGELIEKTSPSLIWRFAESGWILPSYALTLVVLNVVCAVRLLIYLPPASINPV